MMRGASRIATRSLALPATSCATATALAAPLRLFGSKYSDDLGNYKRPFPTESRSGAHRHPPRREVLREQRAAAASVSRPATAGTTHGEAEEPRAPSSPKNHYPEYYKKKPDERLSFTSNFREPDMKPILDAASTGASKHSRPRQASAPEMDDTDVTRIYSKEEVHNMADVPGEAGEVMAAASDDVLDVLSADDAPEKVATREPTQQLVATEQDDDEADEFAEIRSHPFFMDMLRRVERNMIRFRKETRTLGRYSLEAVDECVRPLLQLTDYPLTATQLSHLSHSISPAVLKSSLRDRAACRRLQLYRSLDTNLLLDWSVEDFLRRRYESVHLSWEPMDVICRRFGWTSEMLSDRDYLLYFSAFPEYVEMAELQTTATGEPKAVVIDDPVARAAGGPIPPNRLLLRRKATADAEPSLTESIRLMGSPAVSTPAKGKKAQRMRQHGGDSVSDYFSAAEAAANEVDGDESVKLHHAADTVPPLRQASHPGGRTVREFSIPKTHAASTLPPATSVATAAASAAAEASPSAAVTTASSSHDELAAFDQKRFEEISNAYHNAKVENSLLRRRMLATDNVDKAQEMQAQLAKGRREVTRLEKELEQMRELKRHTTATGVAAAAGFQVPRGLPQYQEAPELNASSKNVNAVEDNEDDEIEQALRDFKEEEELVMEGKKAPGLTVYQSAATIATTAAAAAATHTHTRHTAAATAAEEDEYEEVEVEVEEDDEDLIASEDVAGVEGLGADAEVTTADVEAMEEVQAEAEAEEDMHAVAQPSAVESEHPWQDELEAAVEQQEAEMEEDDFSATLSDVTATAPSARLDQLASLHDRLSSAAERARRYVASVEGRREEVLSKLDRQLADASKKVGKLEEQLLAVEEEQTALHDTLAREEAERKAREVEAQLQAQRERRLAELEQQRERARLAQEEAARALERQKAAEREALAMEEELQRKLRDVQSRLRSLHDGEAATAAQSPPATASAPVVEEERHVEAAPSAPVAAEATVAAAAVEEEGEDLTSAAPVSAGQFMCTPEQYDGLHLAADRLKKEIAALEAQMEGEGDEDDETLMAVLAASRADLEELEECIDSVQANATWAAVRDAKREKEQRLSSQVADSEAHRLQSAIDNHRFQISLLEKRLHHTSQKATMTKLKDRIVQNRKAISHLRIEQDRLRRAGRDALGLPASVSIAETLAHEGKEPEEARLAEDEQTASAMRGGNASRAEAVSESEQLSAEAAEEGMDEELSANEVAQEEETEEESHLRAADGTKPASTAVPAASSSDADKLRHRLDSMVEDIQHLQDSIEAQERSSDYDDDETEGVLREMKEKLSQLLRLRDQVQRALLEESVNAPTGTGGLTPVIRAAAESAVSAPPVMGRTATAVHSGPASSQFARPSRVTSAAKKLRASPRAATPRRR